MTFEEWVSEWMRNFDPADFMFPEVMAERLVEDMGSAGWLAVRPE